MFNHLGLALITSVTFSKLFHIELTPILILLNAVFNYFPDIDISVELMQRGRIGGREHGFHREFTHTPLIYIPISFLFSSVFGFQLAIIFITGVYLHILFDSFGGGWGTMWFWPFSDKRYKLFTDRISGNFSLNSLAIWSRKEFKEIALRHGDDNWFKNIYLKFHTLFLIEILIVAVGLLMLLIYLV